MELPPPHVLLQLDAIIVAQRESEGKAPAPVIAPPAPPPASTLRVSGTPPVPRAVVPRDAPARPRAVAPRLTYPCPASCGCGRAHSRCGECAPCRARHGDAYLAPKPGAPAPQPATRRHVASTASAWVAVCADLLEALKDRTNMRGLREPLVSRGFRCGSEHPRDGRFVIGVPPDFPCYYDVTGKDYAVHDNAQSLAQLRMYLEGALALARAGGAYRTDAEYKPRARAPVAAKAPPPRAPLPEKRTRTPRVIVDPPAFTQMESIRRSKKARKKARALPRELTRRPHVEGAYQKDNGKWANYHMFPGREFDDLDELRAAKRQHAEQRAACVPARISRAFRVSGEKE